MPGVGEEGFGGGMKIVGAIAFVYLLIGILGGPWGRPISDSELAFCAMLMVVDVILLTDADEER